MRHPTDNRVHVSELDMPKVDVDPEMRSKQNEAFGREPGSDDK